LSMVQLILDGLRVPNTSAHKKRIPKAISKKAKT